MAEEITPPLTLNINVSQLLVNDTGEEAKVIDVGQPVKGGSTTFDGTLIVYTAPVEGEEDSFPYTIQDRFGQKSTATVFIAIIGEEIKILAVDDEFTRPYRFNTSTDGTMTFQDTLLLANDLGKDIQIQSVAPIPNLTKGVVSYSTASKLITYTPPPPDGYGSGSDTLKKYPTLEYTYTGAGTDYGTLSVNGRLRGETSMKPALRDIMMLAVVTNTPATRRPSRQPNDSWYLITQKTNAHFDTRIFYRTVDQAFIDEYNASGDQYYIWNDPYEQDGFLAETVRLVTFIQLRGQPNGPDLETQFLLGEVNILEFPTGRGQVTWPNASFESYSQLNAVLYNVDKSEPSGTPSVFLSAKPGVAIFSELQNRLTGSIGPTLSVSCDYVFTTAWAFKAATGESTGGGNSSMPVDDYFNYTINNPAGTTSTAKVHIKFAIPQSSVVADNDTYVVAARERYYTVTGSVRLNGNSTFAALGFTTAQQINVLGYRVSVNPAQTGQNIQQIIGPINADNVITDTVIRIVDANGVPLTNPAEFGFLKLYCKDIFLTPSQVAGLPPLLFGSVTRGEEKMLPLPQDIPVEAFLGNDKGDGLVMDTFTQPMYGDAVAIRSNGDTGTITAIRYTGKYNFRPDTGDIMQYSIRGSNGLTSEATMIIYENTRPE